MRTLICATAALLLSGDGCLAQVSTMGTTAMAIPTTPGAIVSSPLAEPSPFTSLFSAATVPGAPAITLASPPLAQDPTLPGTSVNCSPATAEFSPSVMSVTSNTTASALPTTAMTPVGASLVSGSTASPMSSSTMPPTVLPAANTTVSASPIPAVTAFS